MNIANIMEKISQGSPRRGFILSNCLAFGIYGRSVQIKFPRISCIENCFSEEKTGMRNDFKLFWDLEMEVVFTGFKTPFLPRPARNSKHNNHLLFLFPEKNSFSCYMLDKPRFFSSFENNTAPTHFLSEHRKQSFTEAELLAFLKACYAGVVDELKTRWVYLHTIFPFQDIAALLSHRRLTEDALSFLEKQDKFRDIRRFVGEACFSAINYKNFLEKGSFPDKSGGEY